MLGLAHKVGHGLVEWVGSLRNRWDALSFEGALAHQEFQVAKAVQVHLEVGRALCQSQGATTSWCTVLVRPLACFKASMNSGSVSSSTATGRRWSSTKWKKVMSCQHPH